MNGISLMNVSDGCSTLTCLSLKLRRCYFHVISTVSMLLVIIIINKDYCHIALYKMNCIVLLLQLVSALDLVTSSVQVEGSNLTAGKRLSLKNLNVNIRAIN